MFAVRHAVATQALHDAPRTGASICRTDAEPPAPRAPPYSVEKPRCQAVPPEEFGSRPAAARHPRRLHKTRCHWSDYGLGVGRDAEVAR